MDVQLLQRCVPPEWNARILTDDDYRLLCRQFRLAICEAPIQSDGVLIADRKQPVIFVSHSLNREERQFAMWRELALFLFQDNGKTQEAEAFAACALLPRNLLSKQRANRSNQFLDRLIRLRRKLLDEWNL